MKPRYTPSTAFTQELLRHHPEGTQSFGLWFRSGTGILSVTLTNLLQAFRRAPHPRRPKSILDMSEVHVRKGEPVEKALRRLKKKLDREQTLQQVRLHRRFEKPSARKRRKQKAARFTAMLKARYADV